MTHGNIATRRDANRNRQAILAATERLLDERGRRVPLYEVAREAGVGQATLYRHFPDRAALLSAVLDQRIGELEALVERSSDDPAGLLHLLRAVVEHQASSAAILELLQCGDPGPDAEAVKVLLDRLRVLVDRPIARAVDRGLLRSDFTGEDFLLVLAMVDGVRTGRLPCADRAAAAARVLDLVLSGIGPGRSAAG